MATFLVGGNDQRRHPLRLADFLQDIDFVFDLRRGVTGNVVGRYEDAGDRLLFDQWAKAAEIAKPNDDVLPNTRQAIGVDRQNLLPAEQRRFWHRGLRSPGR